MAEPKTSRKHRRRTVRRWVVYVVVFLLLGAVVNVAVAWGYWQFGQRPRSVMTGDWKPTDLDTEVQDLWRNNSTNDWPDLPEYAHRFESTGLSFLKLQAIVGRFEIEGLSTTEVIALAQKVRIFHIEHTEYGWPTRSMFLNRWGHRKGVEKPAIGSNGWNFDTSTPYVLPIRTLWPGFAINTIFYAVILWLLFAAPFALRRWRHVRNGLCAKCAYPVGDSDICTECGRAVR